MLSVHFVYVQHNKGRRRLDHMGVTPALHLAYQETGIQGSICLSSLRGRYLFFVLEDF
jgi:hypothetical protein